MALYRLRARAHRRAAAIPQLIWVAAMRDYSEYSPTNRSRAVGERERNSIASRAALLLVVTSMSASCAAGSPGAAEQQLDPARSASLATAVRNQPAPLRAQVGAFMAVSGIRVPPAERVKLVRDAFAQEGIVVDGPTADSVLVSLPYRVGKHWVWYRAIITPEPDRTLIYLEAFLPTADGAEVVRVAQAEFGTEGRAWRKVTYVAAWLDQVRRRGR